MDVGILKLDKRSFYGFHFAADAFAARKCDDDVPSEILAEECLEIRQVRRHKGSPLGAIETV
jgi:hypothetical protein